MTDTNIFALAQVIKSAGSDPSDVTDAVWAAGYRKPDRSPEEAVALTLEIICGCEGADLPWEVWPKDYTEVLKGELNEFVVPALSSESSTAVNAAKALISEEYSREEPNTCR